MRARVMAIDKAYKSEFGCLSAFCGMAGSGMEHIHWLPSHGRLEATDGAVAVMVQVPTGTGLRDTLGGSEMFLDYGKDEATSVQQNVRYRDLQVFVPSAEAVKGLHYHDMEAEYDSRISATDRTNIRKSEVPAVTGRMFNMAYLDKAFGYFPDLRHVYWNSTTGHTYVENDMGTRLLIIMPLSRILVEDFFPHEGFRMRDFK